MELRDLRRSIRDSMQDLMTENDLTLANLSRETKIEYKTLANYAQGIFAPNLNNALKLANYFNCSLDYLVGLIDHEEKCKFSSADLEFYKHYKTFLNKNNITHYKLTKDTGINVNDNSKWKKGSIPTLINLIKIAEYLGVSIDSLIGREKIKD